MAESKIIKSGEGTEDYENYEEFRTSAYNFDIDLAVSLDDRDWHSGAYVYVHYEDLAGKSHEFFIWLKLKKGQLYLTLGNERDVQIENVRLADLIENQSLRSAVKLIGRISQSRGND